MFVVEIYAAVRHFVFIEGEESLGPRPTMSVGEANGGHSRQRHLVSRRTLRQFRAEAASTWEVATAA